MLFGADRCLRSVSRYYRRILGQHKNTIVERTHQFGKVTAWQICSSDAAGKQRIPCDQLFLVREVNARAALGMARGVYRSRLQAADDNLCAIVEVRVHYDLARRFNADPCRHGVDKTQLHAVFGVHEDWRAAGAFKFHGATHMVDVTVRDEDLLQHQRVALQRREHAIDIVARIDDDRFV